jgi:hypothetical protein
MTGGRIELQQSSCERITAHHNNVRCFHYLTIGSWDNLTLWRVNGGSCLKALSHWLSDRIISILLLPPVWFVVGISWGSHREEKNALPTGLYVHTVFITYFIFQSKRALQTWKLLWWFYTSDEKVANSSPIILLLIQFGSGTWPEMNLCMWGGGGGGYLAVKMALTANTKATFAG